MRQDIFGHDCSRYWFSTCTRSTTLPLALSSVALAHRENFLSMFGVDVFVLIARRTSWCSLSPSLNSFEALAVEWLLRAANKTSTCANHSPWLLAARRWSLIAQLPTSLGWHKSHCRKAHCCPCSYLTHPNTNDVHFNTLMTQSRMHPLWSALSLTLIYSQSEV